MIGLLFVHLGMTIHFYDRFTVCISLYHLLYIIGLGFVQLIITIHYMIGLQFLILSTTIHFMIGLLFVNLSMTIHCYDRLTVCTS
jgi:hypothetical protein